MSWFWGQNHRYLKIAVLTVVAAVFAVGLRTAGAQALPPPVFVSDMETWIAALNGDAAAITQINEDLASIEMNGLEVEDLDPGPGFTPGPPVPIENDTPMTFADILADPNLPPEFLDATLLTAAMDGDEVALKTLQDSLLLPTPADATPPEVPTANLLANTLIYRVAAGSGDASLLTIKKALEGDPGAINALRGILGDTYSSFLNGIVGNWGCTAATSDPTAIANAVEIIDGALAGEEEATLLMQDTLHVIVSTTTLNTGLLSAGTSWLQGLTGDYNPAAGGSPTPPCAQVNVDDGDEPTEVGDLPQDLLDELADLGIDPQDYLDSLDGDGTGSNWVDSGEEPFEVPDDEPGPTENEDCGEDAPLLGEFAEDPCTWTRDNRELVDDEGNKYTEHQAGWQVVKHLAEWWAEEYLPSLKAMTAQLHAKYIDQSRQFGALIDHEAIQRTRSTVEFKEGEQKRRMMPSDKICQAGTFNVALKQTARGSDALRDAHGKQATARASNAPGTPSAAGPAADQRARFERFCTFFLNPDSNAGKWDGICPAVAPGLAMDSDIDVEGFLLRETIDLNDEPQRISTEALMENLLEPKVFPRLPDDGTNVGDAVARIDGREAILKKQHIQAIRNISSGVIGGIISRRAAVTVHDPEVGNNIRKLRERAGVDPARIAVNPSYNEIMLAMTKERFMDPNYYTKIADDEAALKQEQTAVNSYIAIQMQDIYLMQEQINALLAARASMKLQKMPMPSRMEIQKTKPN